MKKNETLRFSFTRRNEFNEIKLAKIASKYALDQHRSTTITAVWSRVNRLLTNPTCLQRFISEKASCFLVLHKDKYTLWSQLYINGVSLLIFPLH